MTAAIQRNMLAIPSAMTSTSRPTQDLPDPDSRQATRHIEFRDPRPPHEIQFGLERDLMVLLHPLTGEGRLEFQGNAAVNGAACRVVLGFEAALPLTNCYSLRFTMSWTEMPPDSHHYYLTSSSGWFDLWTRHFKSAPPPRPEEGDPILYRRLAGQSLTVDAHLNSPAAVQQEILAALRAGATFSTAHKEGGTTIRFQNGRFVRTDYGDCPSQEEFPDETGFLAFLLNFYQWETSRNANPGPPAELDRWKLILRLIRREPARGPQKAPGTGGLQWVLAFLIALAAVGCLTWLRGGPTWSHRFTDRSTSPPPKAQLPSFDFRPLPTPPTIP